MGGGGLKRRDFLRVTLLALAAAWSPITLPRPRLTPQGTNTITTLNDIFKRVYEKHIGSIISKQCVFVERLGDHSMPIEIVREEAP